MNLVPLAGIVFLLQSLSQSVCTFSSLVLLLYFFLPRLLDLSSIPSLHPFPQRTYLLLSSLLMCQSLSTSTGALGVLSKEGKKKKEQTNRRHIVAHTFNPSSLKAEAGNSLSELEASLVYTIKTI